MIHGSPTKKSPPSVKFQPKFVSNSSLSQFMPTPIRSIVRSVCQKRKVKLKSPVQS